MKIKLKKALELATVLRGLDIPNSTGKTVFTIAKNIQLIEPHRLAAEEAHKSLLKRVQGLPADSNEAKQVNVEWEALLEEELNLDFKTIAFDDLKVGETDKDNKLSANVIAALFPILSDA